MPNSYDLDQLAEPANQVRLLISDTDTADGNFIFDDREIDAFLSMEVGVLLAAARALEVIAANEVLVQKRIEILDLKTDGPAESRELRALAEKWRENYRENEAVADEDLGFDIAEVAYDDFTYRALLLRKLLDNA